MKSKFVHINIVAKNWKKLAEFYINVFGCKIKLPERNLSGEWLDNLTGIEKAVIKGAHLILPEFEEAGPTIEIFEYNNNIENSEKLINKTGFAHIAFAVENVEYALTLVIKHGGSAISGPVKT